MNVQFEDRRLLPVREKVEAGERLSYDDALTLYRTNDVLALGYMANIVREREETIARTEAAQRPWRILLLALAGFGYLLAFIAPLSVLWQRIRIERERDELVVRKIGLWTSTRRVSIEAARQPEIGTKAQMDPDSATIVMSYAWGVRLADREQAIMFWVKATKEQGQAPREVSELVNAIGRVAGN